MVVIRNKNYIEIKTRQNNFYLTVEWNKNDVALEEKNLQCWATI